MSTTEDSSAQNSTAVTYRERLWPAWWIWLSAVVVGLGFGLITTRISGLAALIVAVLVTGGLIGALTLSTPQVIVEDRYLVAGGARVPLVVVGTPEALDAQQMRHWLGPGANALAYLCIRGWISTGVRVPLTDPNDPTPYWLVSSRRPQRLAEAIRAAQ